MEQCIPIATLIDMTFLTIAITDRCTGLPETSNLITTDTFPVDYGVVVTVECSTGYTLEEGGSMVITCEKGTQFTYQPACDIGRIT